MRTFIIHIEGACDIRCTSDERMPFRTDIQYAHELADGRKWSIEYIRRTEI